MSDKSY